jgi:YbgC/YbaW family acyl-CoA thioester hydrolase
VIRETELEILSPLVFDDEFYLTIWLMEWRKVRGSRGFKLERKDNGEIVAQGIQKVVSLDIGTMRPTPPPERFMENFQMDDPTIINVSGLRRTANPSGEAYSVHRDVDWRDLDSLNMVYNPVYISYVEDAILQIMAKDGALARRLKMEGCVPSLDRLWVKYLTPAMWRDCLEINLYVSEITRRGLRIDTLIINPKTAETMTKISSNWHYIDRDTGIAKVLDGVIPSGLSVE